MLPSIPARRTESIRMQSCQGSSRSMNRGPECKRQWRALRSSLKCAVTKLGFRVCWWISLNKKRCQRLTFGAPFKFYTNLHSSGSCDKFEELGIGCEFDGSLQDVV